MTILDKALHKTIYDCLVLQPNESCLILIDKAAQRMGRLLFEKCQQEKFCAALVEIPPVERNSYEPESFVAGLLKQMPVIISATATSLVHSNALKQVCHNGSRVLCFIATAEDVFSRAVNTDFEFIDLKSRRLADLFSIGKEAHLTTPAGTDIMLPITRHKGYANTGIVDHPGKFCLLPAGEASITPDRLGANGKIVVDGSIPVLGLIDKPIIIKVRDGYAYNITGGVEAQQLRKLLKPFGRAGKNVAEFGLGTNPRAELTGASMEDEKVLGTAHIALGNPEFEGGSLKGQLHLDLILRRPTVKIDGHIVVENGRIVV